MISENIKPGFYWWKEAEYWQPIEIIKEKPISIAPKERTLCLFLGEERRYTIEEMEGELGQKIYYVVHDDKLSEASLSRVSSALKSRRKEK